MNRGISHPFEWMPPPATTNKQRGLICFVIDVGITPCENENFFKGSSEIAKAIANNSKNNMLFSVAGGGDTIAVINKTQNFNNFNFVSTACGAFLEYLEGKQLPGIKALN